MVPFNSDVSELNFPGAEAALSDMTPIYQALPPDDVRAFRGRASQVVSNVVQVAQAFADDRPLFAAAFNPAVFDPKNYDDLLRMAQALWQADVILRQILDPEDRLPALIEEARRIRRKLLRAAIYLWEYDDDTGDIVAAIRAGKGHLDTADDLLALANLIGDRWGAAHDKVDVTAADIKRARELSVAMVDALNKRNNGDEVNAARDLRDRAASYAEDALNTLRAAATFVHRNDNEARRRYVGIYAKRGGAKRNGSVAAPEPEIDTPAPAVDSDE